MMQCFFDNSGGADAPVFVMAGYIAREEKWKSFTDDWQKVLDFEKPKTLKRLKMNEAFTLTNRKSEFFGWSEGDRDERLKQFVSVINTHVEHGVAAAIALEPYRRLFAKNFSPTALDRPFFLAFWNVAIIATKITKQLGLDDKIEFIFDDEGGESKALMIAEYEKFVRIAPDSVKPMLPASPRFENDEAFKPIQAADMIAWLFRRYYFDLARGLEPQLEASNKFLANLFKPEHDVLETWDEEKIEIAAKAVDKSYDQKQ